MKLPDEIEILEFAHYIKDTWNAGKGNFYCHTLGSVRKSFVECILSSKIKNVKYDNTMIQINLYDSRKSVKFKYKSYYEKYHTEFEEYLLKKKIQKFLNKQ